MNTERTVIYFVVNRFQIAKMKNIIHAADPNAYFTVSEVAEVFKSSLAGSATAAHEPLEIEYRELKEGDGDDKTEA